MSRYSHLVEGRSSLVRLRSRAGNIVVLTAVLLVVLLVMVALAVDLGYLMLVRTQLQTAADSASIAGASTLTEGPTTARSVARAYATMHQAAGTPVQINADQAVELGVWDPATRTFEALTGSAETESDSVRVTCGCTAAQGNGAHLFFGRVLGRNEADVNASAVAYNKTIPCGRIVGLDWVSNDNGSTDSYDSNVGPYDPATAGNQGHICSNGDITNKPDALIRGNATPGPGHAVLGTGTVTGSTTPAETEIQARAVDPGDAVSSNNNNTIPKKYETAGGGFEIGGNDTYGFSGTYYFAGDFVIKGSAQVNVTGKTIIYVDGNVELGGGGIVNGGQPSQLTILMRGTTATLKGSSAFTGTLYGPTTNISLQGTPDLFGAVLGKTLTIQGDAQVHYDEALRARWMPMKTILVQ